MSRGVWCFHSPKEICPQQPLKYRFGISGIISSYILQVNDLVKLVHLEFEIMNTMYFIGTCFTWSR